MMGLCQKVKDRVAKGPEVSPAPMVRPARGLAALQGPTRAGTLKC